jgi:hypothetical protein
MMKRWALAGLAILVLICSGCECCRCRTPATAPACMAPAPAPIYGAPTTVVPAPGCNSCGTPSPSVPAQMYMPVAPGA